METVTTNNAFGNTFGAAVQQDPPVLPMQVQSNVHLSNPWAQSFANIAPPPVNPDLWAASVAAAAAAAADNPAFAGFGSISNLAAPNAFSAPFGFQFPGAQMPGAPTGLGNFGGPDLVANQFEGDNRGGGDGRSRDVDMRRHDRDRDYRSNNRGGGRGGRDCDRDTDRRDRGGGDRYENNRDRDCRNNNNRDRRRPHRRSTLCSFYSKGYCRDGNKCNFLHPGVNGPMEENNSVKGFNSRQKTSPPGHNNNERRRSPPTNNSSTSTHSFSIHHQSSPTITTS